MNTAPLDPTEEWDPFGKPLFNDPSVRNLSRVGVVDIGSNSVRLVVFDGAARSPAYFYNEKIMCALGAGMAETGHLNPQGRVRAVNALARFQALADGMGLSGLTAVATAAVREATDGQDFVDEVFAKTGMKIRVINGLQEARLSAQGVLLGWPGAYGLVCDIGGSSMELAEIRDGLVGKRVTSNLGPLKLRDMAGGKRGRSAFIKSTVENLLEQMGPQHDRLFLVGGSWRAIARIDMERRGYPLHVLHEYRMSAKSVMATIKFIEDSDLNALRAACGISEARMVLVPIACEVLKRLIKTFKPHDIATSSYGIREGVLYEQMPQMLRDRDPLMEACYFSENKDARMPGFGKVLYQFIRPLVAHMPDEKRRLVKAACLLHDVGWRAHPDYRADIVFETTTRANLGGLKHWERVYLGLSLLHRYKNSRSGSRFEPLFKLLSPALQTEAEIIGKAMRLGAMLWLSEKDRPGELLWNSRARRIELHLSKRAEPLFGEVAQARLQSLASSLNARNVVKIVED